MENASKALIIAGAILLSILIIGLGMMIFNNAKDAISGANLDRETISAFNSKFETYLGDAKKGSNVKSLCDLVRNNNLMVDDSTIFPITINEVTSAEEINALKSSFANGKIYSVTATYSTTTKLIDTITITEVK